MTSYRMYFRSDDKPGVAIRGRDDFEAHDDVEATRVARVLFDACSDGCQSFELWSGDRQIRAQQPHHSVASLDSLINAHQELALEREEVIQRSRWSIARSQRLLAAFDRLKHHKEFA